MRRLGITIFFPHALALANAMLFAAPPFGMILGNRPLDTAPGDSSSQLAGGANANLNDAATIIVDPTRGSVLSDNYNSSTLFRA